MSDDSEYDVTFRMDDGDVIECSVEPGERLLDAALDAEADVRWDCREGRCTSCTSRLLDGDVTWEEPAKAVDEDKREEGYVSLCITSPASDCTIAAGDETLVEAFPLVWQHLDD